MSQLPVSSKMHGKYLKHPAGEYLAHKRLDFWLVVEVLSIRKTMILDYQKVLKYTIIAQHHWVSKRPL